jgi:hypothetical protein
MKIDEIVVYPDREENIEKYHQYFRDSQKTPAFADLVSSRNSGTDEDFLALFSGDRLISVLHLNTRQHGMWQITYAQTEAHFRGQGCFRYLLTTAVSTHGMVLSDDQQTTSSREAWKSLIKYPGPNLKIFVYNTNTGDKMPASGVPENEIWNKTSEPVLLITYQEYRDAGREKVMSKLKESTGIDRTTLGIWYGPNSSTDDYVNP